MNTLVRLPAVLLLAGLASCGGSDSGTPPKDDPVASVTVGPAGWTVDIGATTTLSATVTTQSGANVTSSSTITWSADFPSVATVQGAGATAVVTGVGKGNGGIRARVGDHEGRITVVVVDPNRPEAPSSVAGVPVSTSEIQVGWTDNATNETGFRIDREVVTGAGEGGGPAAAFEQLDQAGVNATLYRDRDVDPAVTYRYLVRACNENGCAPEEGGAEEADAISEPVTVYGGAPVITTSELPVGQYDVEYSKLLSVVGGDGDYVWTVASGSLPAGLELSSSEGRITGVPEVLGTEDFTIEVTSDGSSDQQSFSITVEASPLEMTTYFLAGGYVDEAYTDGLTTRGGDGTSSFSLVAGGLPPGLALDLETGSITGTPTESGVSYFTLQANSGADSDQETFAVAISTKPSDAFNIWVGNASAGHDIPSDGVIEAIEEALARWELHIVGDLEDVEFEPDQLGGTTCSGDGSRLNGQVVDDLVVLLDLSVIDGPGSTLGSAGPCWVRLPGAPPEVNTVFGRLTLDTSDLVSLDDHRAFALAFHEIGHIIGIGTLWRAGTIFEEQAPGGTDLISGHNSDDPRFVGEGGNAEFTGPLGGGSAGAAEIPIEADGGGGTAYSHWDEGEFNNEILTGFSEAPGVTQRISAMTIASVGDMAYEVSTEGADLYSVPGCAPNCSAVSPAGVSEPGEGELDLRDDILRVPIGTFLPGGRIVYFDPPPAGN